MTTELKPCPFCGDEAEVITGKRVTTVQCATGCAQMVAWTDDFPDAQFAIDAWNERHGAVDPRDPFALARALRELGYIVSRITTADGRTEEPELGCTDASRGE